MENFKRFFVKIINEICEEEHFEMKSFSYDWIFSICGPNGKRGFIMGYQFGLNSASVHSICCDKSAASEVMTSLDIPNIQHFFVMSPINQKYVAQTGNWSQISDLLRKYGKIVCKANEGTGGNQVFLVENQYELENAAHKVFQTSRSMAISPYYEIDNEYRTIVLDGEIRLVYSKQRPCVVGDGIHTFGELLLAQISNTKTNVFKEKEFDIPLDSIVEEGKKVYLNWKHNLGQGACAQIETNPKILEKIEPIVRAVVEKMNVRFASIDIVECYDGYRVLEINSGVMMEHFSQQDDNTYAIAKQIYRDAVLTMVK